MGEPVKPTASGNEVVRVAHYSCKTNFNNPGDHMTVHREEEVKVKTIPGEEKKATMARLEEAAWAKLNEVRKKMTGCYSHQFVRFLPTAEELAATLQKQISPVEAAENLCAGEWEIKPACKK